MKTKMFLLFVILAQFVPVLPVIADIIYSNNFENISDPLTEWSDKGSTPWGDPEEAAPGIAVTPGTTQHSSDRFFGQFVGGETTSLTLHNLPSWTTEVRLSFDLYIIRTWDGIGPQGPDKWQLTVSNGPTLLDTTFSNMELSHQLYQSYPGTYPIDSYPARTGAFENNTLGFGVGAEGIIDAVYSFDNEKKIIFPYSDSDLVLNFSSTTHSSGSGRSIDPILGIYDEPWGIDNITIEIVPEPATILLLSLGGLALRKSRR